LRRVFAHVVSIQGTLSRLVGGQIIVEINPENIVLFSQLGVPQHAIGTRETLEGLGISALVRMMLPTEFPVGFFHRLFVHLADAARNASFVRGTHDGSLFHTQKGVVAIG
jgi:hypothetical protein